MFKLKSVLLLLVGCIAINTILFAVDDEPKNDGSQRMPCPEFDGAPSYSVRLFAARNVRVTLVNASAPVEVNRNGNLELTLQPGNTRTFGGASGDQLNFNATNENGIVGEICSF